MSVLGIKSVIWNLSGMELKLPEEYYRVITQGEIEKDNCVPLAIVLAEYPDLDGDECESIRERIYGALYQTIKDMKYVSFELKKYGLETKQIPVLKTKDGETFSRIKSEEKTNYHATSPEWLHRTQ